MKVTIGAKNLVLSLKSLPGWRPGVTFIKICSAISCPCCKSCGGHQSLQDGWHAQSHQQLNNVQVFHPCLKWKWKSIRIHPLNLTCFAMKWLIVWLFGINLAASCVGAKQTTRSPSPSNCSYTLFNMTVLPVPGCPNIVNYLFCLTWLSTNSAKLSSPSLDSSMTSHFNCLTFGGSASSAISNSPPGNRGSVFWTLYASSSLGFIGTSTWTGGSSVHCSWYPQTCLQFP